MRTLLLLLTLSLPALASPSFAAPPEGSQPLSARDLQAIRGVIDDQIAAFRRNDAEGAWKHVAPDLREKFGTPERFLEMVRTGYAPVYAPRRYSYGDLVPTPYGLGQWLEVTGPDGKEVDALYLLERAPDGSWRTSGCLMTEPGPRRPDT